MLSSLLEPPAPHTSFRSERHGLIRDVHFRAVLESHLDPTGGSRYWLERQRQCDADWLADVWDIDDIGLLGPTPLSDLAGRPILDFIPQSLHWRKTSLILTESSGAGGVPITAAFFEEEFNDLFVKTFLSAAEQIGFPQDENWLLMVPTGPHVIGRAARECARIMGSIDPFCIDFDPRYIRRFPAGSTGRIRYSEHLIEQAVRILHTQDVGTIFATTPLLALLPERLSDAERESIRGIHWGGLPPTASTMNEYLAEAYPNATSMGGFGNSLFGVAFETGRESLHARHVYEYLDPRVWADVSVPETDAQSPVRGRIIMHRITHSMLLANILEKDTALSLGRNLIGDPQRSEDSTCGNRGGLY